MISLCETVPQGKGYKEFEQLKSLSLKIQEATSKSVGINERKGKQYVRQIIYINQGHLLAKVTPVIDFTDKPVIQCDIPVVTNYCKQMLMWILSYTVLKLILCIVLVS